MNDLRFATTLTICTTLVACGADPDGEAATGLPPGSGTEAAPIPAGPNGSTPPGAGPAGTMNEGNPGGESPTDATPGDGTPNSTEGQGTIVSTCAPGVPATSQIPRLLNRQYDAVVHDLLGITSLSSTGNPPSDSLYANFDGPINVDVWRLYQDVAAQIAADVLAGPNRSRFIDCDPAEDGCLLETISTFGRKAFRRPLTEAEVERFERLGQTTPAGTPEQVAETTLHAFLVSPSFLQLTELTTAPEGSAIRLSSHEVASRLSFLIWGSIPDDTLNAAADDDLLLTKDQILEQAERMIAVREKTAPLVAAFHRAYLDMDNEDSHWWKVSHDTTVFPHYSDAAVSALQAELDRFFEDLAFDGGSFQDLFLSNVGYVNEDTASIYGLEPAAHDENLVKVELDPERRPGFLTRAGFLSSFSRFDATSPILRGAYITVNIIGVNPGAPNADFFLTPAPEGTYYTEREYVDALTSQAACAGCHVGIINPPGYVLENFDAVGKWQTVDPRSSGDAVTGAIDSTATVNFGDGNVKTISSVRELMEEISRSALAKRIYAERVVSFTTGRLPNPNDECIVDVIDAKLTEDGYGILDLLADLTQADSFRLRVREN